MPSKKSARPARARGGADPPGDLTAQSEPPDILQVIESTFGQPKLTIELLPKSTWELNLRSLLRPMHWNQLRHSAYANANRRCEICGGVGRQHPVECHERWQFAESACVQRLAGLIALCPACHAAKHFGRAQARGFGAEIKVHLATINQWSEHATQRYIDLQYVLWEARSRREWDLDLIWLRNFHITPVPRPKHRRDLKKLGARPAGR